MKQYKGRPYPEVNEVIALYNTPPEQGGFNTEERECPTLFIRLPNTVTLAVVDVNKEELFNAIKTYGHIPQQMKEQVQAKIDEVCCSYIENSLRGDII